MSADERVIDLGIAEDLQARMHKFCPDPHRKHPADYTAHDGEGEVHRSDVLVIGRVNPSPPAMWMIVVCGFCLDAICHEPLFLTFSKSRAWWFARAQLVSSMSMPSKV